MTSTKQPSRRDVPAVTRAIGILRMLARIDEPIGVVPLARRMEMIPSTCLHILRILVAEGFVAFDPRGKKYALGAGLLALGSAFIQRNPFVQVVRGHLDALAGAHGLAFAAVERSGRDQLIVVAVSDTVPGLSVRITTGMRFPGLVSASGRCVAAFGGYDTAELRAEFAGLPWEEPIGVEQWLAEIQQVRIDHKAVDDGNYIRGVIIAAVPVFDDQDALLGCIATIGVRDQMDHERLAAVIAGMQGAALAISRQLGAGLAYPQPPHRVDPADPEAHQRRDNF